MVILGVTIVALIIYTLLKSSLKTEAWLVEMWSFILLLVLMFISWSDFGLDPNSWHTVALVFGGVVLLVYGIGVPMLDCSFSWLLYVLLTFVVMIITKERIYG